MWGTKRKWLQEYGRRKGSSTIPKYTHMNLMLTQWLHQLGPPMLQHYVNSLVCISTKTKKSNLHVSHVNNCNKGKRNSVERGRSLIAKMANKRDGMKSIGAVSASVGWWKQIYATVLLLFIYFWQVRTDPEVLRTPIFVFKNRCFGVSMGCCDWTWGGCIEVNTFHAILFNSYVSALTLYTDSKDLSASHRNICR